MLHNAPTTDAKIEKYLKSRAPFSVLERGRALSQEGCVQDCSRTGEHVSGVVRVSEDDSYTVTLQIVSSQNLTARCTCSSEEDMDEQWCAHAVALLLRAHELDFFHQRSGFPSVESTYQIATSSSEDIAAALRAATEIQEIPASSPRPAEVEIALNTSSDRLGIKLWINKRLHTPSLFESIQDLSDRALDRLLLEAIEDEGRWDESQEIWYINSSHSIELVLGLISEYPQVSDWPNRKKLKFSSEPLTAQVLLEWLPGAAHLRLEWILPSGQRIEKQESVLGTGPYWTVVEQTIYRLTAAAARVAILFPYGPKLTLQRSQLGPLLETIRDRAIDQELLIVLNPEQQPEAIVKTPQPQIQLERPDAATEHFTSHRDIELRATVEFHYPTPSSDSNVVYLPNRRKEREHLEQLRALGLQPLERSRHYSIKGDIALDLLEKGDSFFPARWQVQGLKTVRRGLRFARLTLSVVLRTISNNSSTQSGTDHFDCSISLAQNNAHIPLSSLFKSQEVTNTDRWIRLEGGAYARIPGGSLNQLKSLLESVDPEYRMSNSIHTQLTAPQAISFARLSSADLQVTTDRKLQNIVHKLQDFEGIKRIKTTRGFTGELRPYQADGLSWLNFLHSFELDGILADEMGLGKTVQTLAMLQYLRDSRARNKEFTKPALVVAPTSVTMNWFYEAQRFAPQLKAIVLQGPQRRKYLDDLDNYQLIITSYALLRVDRFELAQYEYSYVILDEAQHIKNPTTATSKAAKALRAQRRLALSGTPTENRPLELWSIFDFLMPGYLGSREFFRSHIERPIIEEGTNVAAVHYLSAKTRPFILRRIKADVERDLPPKTESELHVSMADSQAALYNEILNEVRPQVFQAVSDRGIGGASVSILAALLRLRQVCNHPNSIDALRDVPGYESGKFDLMKELVTEALSNGRKILLFSQFREMLAIIRRWLESQKIEHLYLDGRTQDRQQLVDKFNQDESVRLFLISLKAGGTGINLTGADTVIIYDPWWNPAVEDQAVDRAHRIGQTKAVTVYRLVTEDSIEQKIMNLKSRKAQIVDAIISKHGLSGIHLSKADLESLFSPLPQ